MNYLSLDDFLNSIKKTINDNSLFIVGAGFRGYYIGKYLEQNGIHIKGFVDYDNTKKCFEGKPVINYSDIQFIPKNYYLISTDLYYESMTERLLKADVNKANILPPINRILYDQLYMLFLDKSYTYLLSSFKNKYKNQRCFIVGNGPSLKVEDLNKLVNEKCFACNSIYALYDYTKWRPTFFCAGDTNFLKKEMNNVYKRDKVLNNSNYIFISLAALLVDWVKAEKDNPKICYFFPKGMETMDSFSSDCIKCIYTANTVTFIMLQLAVYMGFSEIYLLGIDFTFTEQTTKEGTTQIVQKDCDLIEKENAETNKQILNMIGSLSTGQKENQLRGYQAAKKYADAHGIKIYNATRGGKLEVFPRVDFGSLFEK